MRYSWGRLPIPGPAQTLERDWRFHPLPDVSLLPYGRGRSYGDSCINSGGTHIGTRALNRFIAFDEEQGLLECEAGLTLDEILQVIVPRGWFLPVVPGTRQITLGGAIANDVHGKNHHRAGSFGCHLNSLKLLRSDGSRLQCSPGENADLFAATIGGLGLTGLVTSARMTLLPLASDWLATEDLPFDSLREFSSLSEESADWDYTVAWVDTTGAGGPVGRGIFSRARHQSEPPSPARPQRKIQPGVPLAPPFSLVGKSSVSLFNRAYFWAKSRNKGLHNVSSTSFFFPLDAIGNWNRIYGSKGFYQYQCVVPVDGGIEATQQLLNIIEASGAGSFLAVLKAFGNRSSPGLLSFPRPGLTLALDFPNRGEQTLRLMCELDRVVGEAGGALYPAKDARMPAELFHAGFPAAEQFSQYIDPNFSSSFWRRVNP